MKLIIIFFSFLFICNSNVLAQAPANSDPCKVEIKNNEVLLTSISAIKSNSKYDNFKVKYKIEKVGNDNFKIYFTFYTNVQHIQYAQGFCYTLFDATGKKYPLIVNDLGGVNFNTTPTVDKSSFTIDCWILNNVALAVSKSTLRILAKNGLDKIQFQIKNTNQGTLSGQISCYMQPDGHYIGNDIDLGQSNYLLWKINSNDRIKFREYVLKLIQ